MQERFSIDLTKGPGVHMDMMARSLVHISVRRVQVEMVRRVQVEMVRRVQEEMVRRVQVDMARSLVHQASSLVLPMG